MKLNKRQFNQWLKHLYAGTYAQGKGCLQNAIGFCCLGVACEVLIPDDKKILRSGQLAGSYPFCQDNAPQWVMKIDDDFKSKMGVRLSVMNDHGMYTGEKKPFTHTEIAMLLDLVYNYNALDNE